MLKPEIPALILAPMDGVTDAPMRAAQGEVGAFTFAVSEFLRVSQNVPGEKVFLRHIPELCHGARTPTGLPVQVQLLGGEANLMAEAACVACEAGAGAIDINFGCPAPTVNRHDGGATLLKYPLRIREIVGAVRRAVPPEIPVSAKLRLGWDTQDAILENAEMAAEGGANWLTIHGRTKTQRYDPPAYWEPIGAVNARLNLPIVANGDLWRLEDFRRCREITGCRHFMLGRGAMANPLLARLAARELGLAVPDFSPNLDDFANEPKEWIPLLERLVFWTEFYWGHASDKTALRLKQWLKWAATFGEFRAFDAIKRTESPQELFAALASTASKFQDGKTDSESGQNTQNEALDIKYPLCSSRQITGIRAGVRRSASR